MLIMFGIVILNANIFGAEGLGTIGLMVLNITILQLVTSFIGGTTLVYLIPRRDLKKLLVFSLIWAVLGNIGGLLVLKSLALVPKNYIILLLVISIVFSFNSINMTLLQAFEKIKKFNFFQILQAVLLIVSIASFLLVEKTQKQKWGVDLYFYSFLISYLGTFLFSTFAVIKSIRNQKVNPDIVKISKSWFAQLKELLSLGFWVQIANLAQLLNYRLSYYFIEYFVGRKPLGIFDLGTKLSEAIWIFPKSLCLVQYARLSNNDDADYARKITVIFSKIASLFTLLVLVVLLLIPGSFFTFIFGAEFIDVKAIIYALAPGIFFLSCLTILSHHFAAKGEYWKNSLSSFIGLIFTAVGGYFFIPMAAKSGYVNAIFIAGIVTSVSYLMSLIVTILFFHRESKLKLHDFLISDDEFLVLKTEIQKLLKRKTPNL